MDLILQTLNKNPQNINIYCIQFLSVEINVIREPFKFKRGDSFLHIPILFPPIFWGENHTCQSLCLGL